MRHLSSREIAERLTTCKCGGRVALIRILISSRSLVALLPEGLKKQAQALRERGQNPATLVGRCSNCGKAFGTLLSTEEEK